MKFKCNLLTHSHLNPVIVCHIANHYPRQEKNVIRTSFQMINNCRGKMEGLVSSGKKFQTTPNYRDEMHI